MKVDGPVLSIYLNTGPAEGSMDDARVRLRNLLKQVPSRQDAAVVERFMEVDYERTGRSLAIFSSAVQGLFRAYSLAVPIPDQVYASDRPVVKPLVTVLDAYGGYGVVLMDKQGARLFYFHLGELREQEGVLGEAVKHTKRGGASSFPGRRGGTAGMTRAAEETVDRNMRDTVEFAIHFLEQNHVRRILLGGTDDNLAIFKNHLPKAWQSLVVGTFAMPMTASHTEVMTRAMQVGQEEQNRNETRLVENTITAAAKGAGGVVGLEETLKAVHAGRVKTLVVIEDYHEPAYRCKACGYLTIIEMQHCPACGGAFEPISDGVELAVQLLIKSGGEVDVVHRHPALVKAGEIGALMRY
jgi:peptide subunit release factor 1 (eRF1)